MYKMLFESTIVNLERVKNLKISHTQNLYLISKFFTEM
jgi:hypothetical protein